MGVNQITLMSVPSDRMKFWKQRTPWLSLFTTSHSRLFALFFFFISTVQCYCKHLNTKWIRFALNWTISHDTFSLHRFLGCSVTHTNTYARAHARTHTHTHTHTHSRMRPKSNGMCKNRLPIFAFIKFQESYVIGYGYPTSRQLLLSTEYIYTRSNSNYKLCRYKRMSL